MRAAVQRAYGGSQVLTLEEIEAPTPGPGEIVVQVEAAPVTQADRRLREADFPGVTWLPRRLMAGVLRPRYRVPGVNFAGRVSEVGDGVVRFAPGDRVVGATFSGAFAEKICVSADGPVVPLPRTLSPEPACGLPYGLGTARAFIQDWAQVRSGERVLIVGASGVIGAYAVQLADHAGAEVHAVTRRDDDDGRLRDLGAREIFRVPPERRYDVVFDTTGTLSFRACRSRLTSSGRYLTLYLTVGILLWMVWTRLRPGPRALFGVVEDTADGLEQTLGLAADGAVRPLVDSVLPFHALRDAHDRLAEKPTGAVVVRIGAASAPASAA
ncbi:MAG: NAD(P)-dependent alcohol dehydrogenase [Myxococcota bacterium]